MAQKKQPITAIITRTKDRPVLLERAIKSVVSQTSKSYVHIVLNDGGAVAPVEALLENYPDENRRVIHNDKSVGLTGALNQAIRSSESEYIAILDDDDSWMPERIQRVADYLKEHTDKSAVAVQMDRVIERIDGDDVVELSREAWYEGVTEVSLYDQLLDNYLTNNCLTYRRCVYDTLNGYDETLEVGEDWDFGIRLLLETDVSFIPEVLALYHHRPDMKGSGGNSVFAARDVHERSLTKLRNRYLRADIKAGSVGVGHIMNSLHHERQVLRTLEAQRDEQTVRIEGHINHSSDELRGAIDASSLYRTLRKKIGN